jgi:hypothetical protein
MDSRYSRDWLQIISRFGVVASLIFVGWQIEQDREIARSVAYQSRSDTAAEFYWTIGTDAAASSAMEKIRLGNTELTSEESVAAEWIWRSGKEIMQNSYYQYQHGYLDEEHWAQVRSLIKFYLQAPLPRSVLQDGNSRQSFQELINEIEAEILAESAR